MRDGFVLMLDNREEAEAVATACYFRGQQELENGSAEKARTLFRIAHLGFIILGDHVLADSCIPYLRRCIQQIESHGQKEKMS